MSGTYFVLSKINHDGTEFNRGDEFTGATSAIAQLVEAGVLSTEEPTDEVVALDPEAAAKEVADKEQTIDGAKVGGEVVKTGEPSLDKDGPDAPVRTEAQEVHPGGFLGRFFGGKKPEEVTETVKVTITAEDIAAHPALSEAGFKAGQEVEASEIPAEVAEAIRTKEAGTDTQQSDPAAGL